MTEQIQSTEEQTKPEVYDEEWDPIAETREAIENLREDIVDSLTW